MSSTESLVEPALQSPPPSPTPEQPSGNRRGPFARTWVRWTVGGVVAALVLGVGAGLWVNQNSSQNAKLDAMISQQVADKTEAQARADKAAAAAKAAQAKAKAKAEADDKALKEYLQGQALQKAQQDAAEAKQRAEAAERQAQANANRPPTVIVPQTPYYREYTPSYTSVWGNFPLIGGVSDFLSVRESPISSSPELGRIYVGESVGVVCSTTGEYVDPAGYLGTDDWDWVTYPAAGWVADAYVNTDGRTAPRC